LRLQTSNRKAYNVIDPHGFLHHERLAVFDADQVSVEAGRGGQTLADFRLTDASAWERYYGSPHAGSWPYGLRVVGIDRFLVPWPCLAHGGKSRLFRMA